MTIPYADLQELNQTSGWVELFMLDATNLGGSVHRFTNHPNPDGGYVKWGGEDFMMLPVKSEGWDFTSTGAPPKPKLTVSNVSRHFLSDVIGLGDLVGARLSRVRTYVKYLDAATFTRRNLLNYSQSIDTTTSGWQKVNTVTVANSVAAPDGTLTAERIREVATTPGSPFFYATQTCTVGLSGTTYTFSAYVKAGERTFANMRFDDGAGVNTCAVGIDLTTGTLGTVASAGSVTNASATIMDCTNGWHRVALTATWASISAVRVFLRPAIGLTQSSGDLGYAGDITKGLYYWGAQLDVGSSMTAYQPTTTTHQPFADSSKYVGPEVFIVEQKTGHNNEFIQWQLTSILDRLGMKLPRRQILKDRGFPGVARTRVIG